MRKLFEIEIKDEIKKSTFVQYAVCFLTFALFFMVRTYEQSYFNLGFYIEMVLLILVLRFFNRSHRNKNFAFWGYAVLIGLYIVKNILYFTFITHNIFILYFSFLAILFLGINIYLMSSPLYYPRIQWWEYDFRYRGELKAKGKFQSKEFDIRIADLRRNCVSVLSFESLPLGSKLRLEIPYENNVYNFSGTVKTLREVIPGRPISYGLKINFADTEARKEVLRLEKVWKLKKKANLRAKFSELKKKNEVH